MKPNSAKKARVTAPLAAEKAGVRKRLTSSIGSAQEVGEELSVRRVLLDAPGEENWNKYRAYEDTIGTYFFVNNKRIKITKASFKNGTFTIERVIPEGKKETNYQSGAFA